MAEITANPLAPIIFHPIRVLSADLNITRIYPFILYRYYY